MRVYTGLLLAVLMVCGNGFPKLHRQSIHGNSKGLEEQLINDLLKTLEARKEEKREDDAADLDCVADLSAVQTQSGVDFTDTANIRCIPSPVLGRLGHRLERLSDMSDEEPVDIPTELESFLSFSACVIQAVGPQVVAELQLRREQGGREYILPTDCPAPRDPPTEEQCAAATSTLTNVDSAMGTDFRDLISSDDPRALHVGLTFLSIFIQRVRDSTFTLTGDEVSISDIDCLLGLTKDEISSRLHLLAPSGSRSDDRASGPTGDASNGPSGPSRSSDGDGEDSNEPSGDSRPDGGRPGQGRPGGRPGGRPRDLFLSLLGMRSYKRRDAGEPGTPAGPDSPSGPDGGPGNPGDQNGNGNPGNSPSSNDPPGPADGPAHGPGSGGDPTGEECAELLDMVELFTEVDYGYAEHISCISNADFVILANYISRVAEHRFVNALNRIGNSDARDFFSLIGCSLAEAGPRIAEIAETRREAGGELPSTCAERLPEPTHEQCITILGDLDTDGDDILQVIAEISAYRNPTLLRATISFLYIQIFRLQDPMFVVPEEGMGGTRDELSCIFYALTEHFSVTLLSRLSDSRNNPQEAENVPEEVWQTQKRYFDVREIAESDGAEDTDGTDGTQEDGAGDDTGDGTDDGAAEGSEGTDDGNDDGGASVNDSDDEEWCAQLIDTVEDDTGIDFANVDHLSCISSDDFSTLTSHLMHINEDRYVRALGRQRNENVRDFMTFVGCALGEIGNRFEEVVGIRQSADGSLPETCQHAIEAPTHARCLALIGGLIATDNEILESFSAVFNLRSPLLTRAAIAFFHVQIFRMRDPSFQMPPETGVSREEFDCLLYGITEFLSVQLITLNGRELEARHFLDEVSPSDFLIKARRNEDDVTVDEGATADCASIITAAEDQTAFDFSTPHVRCIPTSKLVQSVNAIERMRSHGEEAAPEGASDELRTFMEFSRCVLENHAEPLITELNRRRTESDYMTPADCPTPRDPPTSEQCQQMETPVDQIDSLLNTRFEDMIATADDDVAKLGGPFLGILMQKIRASNFILPDTATVTLEQFDCIIHKIKNQLTGILTDTGRDSGSRSGDNDTSGVNSVDTSGSQEDDSAGSRSRPPFDGRRPPFAHPRE